MSGYLEMSAGKSLWKLLEQDVWMEWMPFLSPIQHCHVRALYTLPFNGPYLALTRLSRYQKGKANLDFTEARDSEWQWRQLGHMQVCISLQTDNHTSTPPLSFLHAGCPSCHPANIVKALIIVINQYTGAILRIHWISLCVAITRELSQNVWIYRDAVFAVWTRGAKETAC